VVRLWDVGDFGRVVWSQAACLVNGVGNVFACWSLHVHLLLMVLGLAHHLVVQVLLFQILLLLATVVSVINFSSLWPLLVLEVHIWILDIGGHMMRLEMIFIFKYEKVFICMDHIRLALNDGVMGIVLLGLLKDILDLSFQFSLFL
jgi:hypothetical protein